MSDGRNYHRQLGLRCSHAPNHACKKGRKAQAKLQHENKQERDRRPTDRVNFGELCNRTNSRPGKEQRNDDCVQYMRPPWHALMAKHGPENKLYVKNQNRKQAQGQQRRTILVSDGRNNFFNPLPSSEDCDQNRDTKKSLCHGGVRG